MNNAELQNQDFVQKINFRCPSCSKLFSADPNQIFVEEPEFQCNSCETPFKISLFEALVSSEVVGVKTSPETVEVTPSSETEEELEEPALPVESRELEQNDDTSLEVSVKVPQSFETATLETQKEESSSVKETVKFEETASTQGFEGQDFNEEARASLLNVKLSDEWLNVLEDYDSVEAHDRFMDFCKAHGKSDFALGCYNNILNENPHDEVASKAVTKFRLSNETKLQLETFKENKLMHMGLPLAAISVVLLGLLMIFLGLLMPQYKNLVGLGVGLIFFTFAVKAFFQPKKP